MVALLCLLLYLRAQREKKLSLLQPSPFGGASEGIELTDERSESKLDRKSKWKIDAEVRAVAAPLGRSRETISLARDQLVAHLHAEDADEQNTRFALDSSALEFGRMKDAALGVAAYLCVPKHDVYKGLLDAIPGQPDTAGLPALRREFESHGTDEDKLCMRYVLDGEAGSCDVVFPNGNLKLDCDASGALHSERLTRRPLSSDNENGDSGAGVGDTSVAAVPMRGWRLRDFAAHPKAKLAGLSLAETAALRLYTTAAYKSINTPLRDLRRRERNEPHPLPLTVMLIAEGVSKLRAVGADSEDANKTVDLYRGMRNRELPKEFVKLGGTELAPMSTTPDLGTALSYSASKHGVLFQIRTQSSMERGADLAFLSGFPNERECLFPPLTYLQPARPVKVRTVNLAGAVFTIVEVEPKM